MEYTLENLTAYEIYNYLKNKIKTLPKFWYQVIEDNDSNNDAVLFVSSKGNQTPEYFSNDEYARLTYKILFYKNRSKHQQQLTEFKKIIREAQKIKDLETGKIILKRINGVVIDEGRDKSNLIQFDEPQLDNETQLYELELDLLLEIKAKGEE